MHGPQNAHVLHHTAVYDRNGLYSAVLALHALCTLRQLQNTNGSSCPTRSGLHISHNQYIRLFLYAYASRNDATPLLLFELQIGSNRQLQLSVSTGLWALPEF